MLLSHHTIHDTLKTNAHIDRHDAELIIAHVLQKSREFLITHPEYKISKLQETRYKRLLKKRAKGIPLAYLTGHKEFFGLDFEVNKHTLVPRPDTETMVTVALEHISHNLYPTTCNLPAIIIDVGTGTGCIPIAIIKALQQKSKKKPHIFGTDISKKALRVAKQNAKKHNVNITLLHGNLLEPFFDTCRLADLQTYQLVVTANLPYLDQSWYNESPSIHHEPKSALVADNKGTTLYEKLFQQIVNSQLSNVNCYVEIDPRHVDQMKQLAKKYFPHAVIEIKKDLAGHNRVLILHTNTKTAT